MAPKKKSDAVASGKIVVTEDTIVIESVCRGEAQSCALSPKKWEDHFLSGRA